MRKQNKKLQKGFTLIELLIVIAVIAVLSSIALISLNSSRKKARDVKRLGDMTKMATAMELYYNSYKGYPHNILILPPLGFVASLPNNPQPPDGNCANLNYPAPGAQTGANYYYYASPTGGSYVLDGVLVYPDYAYFFCLGNQTGNFPPGIHWISPKGLR